MTGRHMNRIAGAALGLMLALTGVNARAADACPFPPSAVAVSAPGNGWTSALRRLSQSDCAGDAKADPAPISKDVARLTAPQGEALPEPLALAMGIQAALERMAGFARTRAQGNIQSDAWAAIAIDLADTHTRIEKAMAAATAQTASGVVESAIPRKWLRAAETPSDGLAAGDVTLRPLATLSGCIDTAPCPAFDSQLDMLRVVNLMATLTRYAQSESLRKSLVLALRENKRWQAYRSQGQHQYIWEVWLNGQVMDRQSCVKRNEASGEKVYIGFCAVPTSQWIVMHPDAALRWSHDAAKSSQLKPALIVETLGYYRWDWQDADSATMVGRRGVSLAAVYTGSSEHKWSWGPMLHYEGYNLALTKAPGERWGLVVNLQLSDLFFERKQSFVDTLQRLQK